MSRKDYLFKNRQNKGFTLVEMIVTIVILSIMAGLTVTGIITWQQWSDFRKENEYAQTLFVAAQNQLNEYSANGRLAGLQTDIFGTSADGTEDLSKLPVKVGTYLSPAILEGMRDEEGNFYDVNAIWPESRGKKNPEYYQKKIVSLRAEAGQFAAYSNDPEAFRTADPQAYWVYEILSSYVYDTAILNDGAVCVEFTPEDGQVFSVLYSDKNTSFCYRAAGEKEGTDISDREETVREKSMVGFYGADSLYASTRNKADNIAVSKVRLHNEDTFYLTYRLSKENSLTSALQYTITLLDAETGSSRLQISLDGSGLKNESHATAIDCPVTRYPVKTDAQGKAVLDGEGRPLYETAGTEIGTFPVLAWIDEENTVHVLLDAADIQATSYLYDTELAQITENTTEASKTRFAGTYSFFRFGVEGDRQLLASVSATDNNGTVVKEGVSAKAKTPCFASGTRKSTPEGDDFVYTVENERHFYNIRYITGISYEKQADASALTEKVSGTEFVLKSSLDWEDFTQRGQLYDTYSRTSYVDISQLGTDRYSCPFPSFKQIRDKDTLNGDGKTVTGIQITEAADALYDTYSVGSFMDRKPTNLRPTGLATVNYGTVKELTLDDFRVSGSRMTGGFCGINAGTLQNLKTTSAKNASLVSGTENVGGITGYQLPSGRETVLTGLTNYAAVQGKEAVGGIVGMLRNEYAGLDLSEIPGLTAESLQYINNPLRLSVTVKDCANYGQIGAAAGSGLQPEDCRYIGGIAGCLYNRYNYATGFENITIENCTGAPLYEEAEIKGLTEAEEFAGTEVCGSYVGGIVGYNSGGRIKECSTASEKGGAGYVLGYRYVGGIAGGNDGIIIASGDGDTGLHVIGYEGVGGIAGYNDRILEADSTVKVNAYVKGKDYVGGIVGYNDENAEIENYAFAGGSIYAVKGGCFAGGIAGLNSAPDLLINREQDSRKLSSTPRTLQGEYFVGGIAGGNVLNTASAVWEDISSIQMKYANDSLQGTCEGRAFAGGYMGYLAVLEDSDGDAAGKWAEQITDAFAKADASSSDEKISLKEKVNILDSLPAKAGKKEILIQGENKKSASGSVKAGIYAGGVIGYADNACRIRIYDVENRYKVEATLAIENRDEQKTENKDGSLTYRTTDYAGADYTFTYSYAGGIIGKAGENTTLEKCRNGKNVSVTGKGTYSGALCEVNAGLITDCKVQDYGQAVRDYVGGLCGLNEKTGRIQNCSMENAEVKGRNVTGGFAAENFGEISGAEIKNAGVSAAGVKVTRDGESVTDGVAGIYAGHNGSSGTITLEKDIDGVTVRSNGAFAGLVTGYNHGQINNGKAAAATGNTNNNLTLKGTLEADRAAGALIGCNADTDSSHEIAFFTNLSNVKTRMGEAGGIIGVNASANTIRYCENKALITATDGGNSGGITSSNHGLIAYCRNYTAVLAPNGMCGGITAINEEKGTIQNCTVKAEQDGSVITFTSDYEVGGIAARNAGIIRANRLIGIKITNSGQKTGTYMGVVTGKNLRTGKIYIRSAGDAALNGEPENKDCEGIAEGNDSKMGGVAGSNAGLIQGDITATDPDRISSVISSSLKLGKAKYACMGGVTGVNTGTVDHIAVDAQLAGNLGDAASGYGGIAGYNGYTTKVAAAAAGAVTNISVSGNTNAGTAAYAEASGYAARITYCSFDGSVNAVGSSGKPAKIGGIAGSNSYGAIISNCMVGSRKATEALSTGGTTSITAGDVTKDSTTNGTDKISYAYIGGIAGENYGRITDIDSQKYTTDTVQIISFAGEVGGIAGINYPGGVISGYAEKEGTSAEVIHPVNTGDKWSVEMRCAENDRGPGGIIGLNESGQPISYVDNRASVTINFPSNVKTGGFIGVNMQMESRQLAFKNCNNYGTVTGWNCVGGFLGHNFYRGITFEECINYGEVRSTEGSKGSQRYVAGFVSGVHTVYDNISFESCKNHGYIHASAESKTSDNIYVAGFVSYFIDFTGTGYMTDCVNTGIVGYDDGGDDAVKKHAGSFLGNASSTWYLNLCRNYNTETEGNYSGFSLSGRVILKDCLDDSNVRTNNTGYSPFGGAYDSSSNNNYYLNDSSAAEADTMDYDAHGAYFSVHQGTDRVWKIYRNGYEKDYNTFRNNAYLLEEPSIETRIIAGNRAAALNFSITQDAGYPGMDGFVMYFASARNEAHSTNKYQYFYKVYMTDKNGNRYEAVIDTSSLPEGAVNDTYLAADKGGWNGITVQGTDDFSTYRVVARVPEGVDKKDIQSVQLVTSANCNENPRFYGFGWIPSGQAKEAVLTPLVEKNGIRVDSAGTSNLAYYSETEAYDYLNNNGNVRGDILDTNYYLPGHTGEYRLDAGGTNYGNRAEITLNFGYEDDAAAGIGKINYILSNGKVYRENKTGDTDVDAGMTYSYWYTITDANGNVYALPQNSAKTITVSKVSDGSGQEKLTMDIAEMAADAGIRIDTTKITKIQLYIKNTAMNGGNGNRYVYFKGITYEPDDGSAEQRFAWYNKAASDGYKPGCYAVIGTGVFGIHKLLVDYSGYQGGSQSAPYVHTSWNKRLGFTMDANDPVHASYYADKTQYEPEGQPAVNSRIGVYLDIDPKFVAFIQETYVMGGKMQTPGNLKATIEKGSVNLSWNRVTLDVNRQDVTPYRYAVSYEIRDKEGNLVKSDVTYQAEQAGQGTQKWEFPLAIEKEWSEKECTISFKVKALSIKHFTDGDESLDSDWSGTVSISLAQTILIEPKVHLEVTAANKTVAILENRDEYLENTVLTYDENGSAVKVPMSETCNITVTYHSLKLTIDPALSEFSTEAAYDRQGGYSTLTAVAEPKKGYESNCLKSTNFVLKGMASGNGNLVNSAKVCWTDFIGFFGTEADGLMYEIDYKGNDDFYLLSDIGAYEETIGTYVYYGKEITHMGGNADNRNQMETALMKDLPKEWFDENSFHSIEVRSFLYKSQIGILYFGHEVASGIALNGKTTEENQSILAGITDAYYLTGNADAQNTADAIENVVIRDYSVWDADKKCLKPGYTLYENADGTYDIYYNASVELSKANAAKYMQGVTKKSEELPDRKYYNYCVNVLVYDNMADCKYPWAKEYDLPVDPESKVNVYDFQESAWVRYQNGTDRNWTGYDYYKKDTNAVAAILQMQPAPIPDGDIVIGEDGNGKTTYSVAWDTYYQDTYCWNRQETPKEGVTTYGSNDWRYLTRLGLADTYADPDAVSSIPKVATWEKFRDNNLLYDDYFKKLLADPNCSNNWNMRAMMLRAMQGYYFAYADASYKAEIIGTTINGDEIVLQTEYVDTPVQLPSYYDRYTVYTNKDRSDRNKTEVSTEYKRWNYQTTFTDEEGNWDQYEQISVRITHLGSDATVGNINRQNSGRLENGIDFHLGNLSSDGVSRALVRLPRYTEISVSQKDTLSSVEAPEIRQILPAEAEYPLYRITWKQLTDEAMKRDVGGYLITVRDASVENALATRYYYVNTLAADSGENLTIGNLLKTGVPVDAGDTYQDNGDGTGSVSLDLSAFDGRTVKITLRALARDNTIVNPTVHRHGEEGDASTVKVVNALPAPDVSCLSGSTEEEIRTNRSILLSYEDKDSRYEGLGLSGYHVEISASVYENREADAEEILALYQKDTPLIIRSNSTSGANLIDNSLVPESILDAYAGKYIRITLRAVGENSVSSRWTDESTGEETEKYAWIRIPEADADGNNDVSDGNGSTTPDVSGNDKMLPPDISGGDSREEEE